MSDIEERIERWRAGLAGSEVLGNSTADELESHLMEELEHLKASGLSGEEAFLVARRRLGDTSALEEEFAKVDPHKRVAHRLYWMATGVLGYFLILHLSLWVTKASTLLGYEAGLRNPYLTIFACFLQVAAFAGIGALVLRYYASRSRSRTPSGRASVSRHAGLFVACGIVALWWTENLFFHGILVRRMLVSDYSQFIQASGWASMSWGCLMPFLVAGLVAVLALCKQRCPETR